jgi:hypothetical protein
MRIGTDRKTSRLPGPTRWLGANSTGRSVCGIILLAMLITPAGARAQIRTYYRVGVWDAFSGRNDSGGAVCGVGNTSPADNRRLSLRFDIGGTDTVFEASKPGWTIPENTRVTVVMQVGLNTPATEQATGHGQTIGWTEDPGAMQAFDRQFRDSSSLTLTFPDGNEPPWTISLAGSSAISDAFGRCISDLTQQVAAARRNGVASPPPAAAPTQPFTPPEGAPPADAPSASAPPLPAATQPTR